MGYRLEFKDPNHEDNVQFIYYPSFEAYEVFVCGKFVTTFSLEKYWIFIKGELRNGKTESDTGNGD